MKRNFITFSMLASTLLLAVASFSSAQQQPSHTQDHDSMNHASMNHASMNHDSMKQNTNSTKPVLGGQDAFAAIQEIVTILQEDPQTDWSRVDINALREHLIDMNRVTLEARVQSEEVEGGARHRISSDDTRTIAAIQRMVTAHAAWMKATSTWSTQTTQHDEGVTLTVTSKDANDETQIRALGFMGFMVQGKHHQPHHLKMARGEDLHAH
ncbi:hypothetical protein LG277_00405 [Vreelandella aquamarina]|uniref:hypothetical protein n=1 Tax=Vreelandella aquamarina TaxID=77097 RepID=UPI00385066E5